jgi:hypothetical protein
MCLRRKIRRWEVDDDSGPSEIRAIFLSAVKVISNARKYLMMLHVEIR